MKRIIEAPILLETLRNRRKTKWWQLFRGEDYFKVAKSFRVNVSQYGDVFQVPAGFKTDLASIPRLFQGIFSKADNYNEAAIVHDYMYRSPTQIWRGRKAADDLFLRIMEESNVPAIQRYPIYWGVKAFGWLSYQKNRRKNEKRKF